MVDQEAVKIRQESQHAMNQDHDAYQFSHLRQSSALVAAKM